MERPTDPNSDRAARAHGKRTQARKPKPAPDRKTTEQNDLITFMKLLKQGDVNAVAANLEYERSGDQELFMNKIKDIVGGNSTAAVKSTSSSDTAEEKVTASDTSQRTVISHSETSKLEDNHEMRDPTLSSKSDRHSQLQEPKPVTKGKKIGAKRKGRWEPIKSTEQAPKQTEHVKSVPINRNERPTTVGEHDQEEDTEEGLSTSLLPSSFSEPRAPLTAASVSLLPSEPKDVGPQNQAPERADEVKALSPGRDEAYLRLQELLSSNTNDAFSTSFAFSRWRASVQPADISHNVIVGESKLVDTSTSPNALGPSSMISIAPTDSLFHTITHAPPITHTEPHAHTPPAPGTIPDAFMPPVMPFMPYPIHLTPLSQNGSPPTPANSDWPAGFVGLGQTHLQAGENIRMQYPGHHPPFMMGMGPYGMVHMMPPHPYMMMNVPYGLPVDPIAFPPYAYHQPPTSQTHAPVNTEEKPAYGAELKRDPINTTASKAGENFEPIEDPTAPEVVPEVAPTDTTSTCVDKSAVSPLVVQDSSWELTVPKSDLTHARSPNPDINPPDQSRIATIEPNAQFQGPTVDTSTQSLLKLLKSTRQRPVQDEASQGRLMEPIVSLTPTIAFATADPKEDISTSKEGADSSKKHVGGAKLLRRVVTNKHFTLDIIINNEKAPDGIEVRPQGDMKVRWRLPVDFLEGCHIETLVIGLHRLGVGSNSNNIVTKKVTDFPILSDRDGLYRGGNVPFRAPRAPGIFVYRLFSETEDTDTLASTTSFIAVLTDHDVVANLRYVSGLLNKSDTQRSGLVQLIQCIKLIKRPPHDDPTRQMVATCLQVAFNLLYESIDEVEKARAECEGNEVAATSRDALGLKEAKVSKLHIQLYELFFVTVSNHEAWTLVPPSYQQEVITAMSRYCSLLGIFCSSVQTLRALQLKKLGFIPAPKTGLVCTSWDTMTSSLTYSVTRLLPQLGQSQDFYTKREAVRKRLNEGLITAAVVPSGTQLKVFGSSANGFGTEGSDLDMSLVFPGDPPANRAHVIEQVAAELEGSMGMSNVSARPTARIPIVIFTDTDTGLECDISIHNPLAVRNTQLLKVYSEIDPRVRKLANIVKHWTKCRKINSAPDGTLSSYGYILCVIHFLQTLDPPLLPVLQKLPPNWNPLLPEKTPLPYVPTLHPVEGTEIDTYFYVPPRVNPVGSDGGSDTSFVYDFSVLQQQSSLCGASVGTLLADFFRYFACKFDYKGAVVTVREKGLLVKEKKAEVACWPLTSRLSVEDPFETFYDVAHPVKNKGMRRIQTELARAYTLCCKASGWSDGTNVTVQPEELLDVICEPRGEFEVEMDNDPMEDGGTAATSELDAPPVSRLVTQSHVPPVQGQYKNSSLDNVTQKLASLGLHRTAQTNSDSRMHAPLVHTSPNPHPYPRPKPQPTHSNAQKQWKRRGAPV